VAIILALAHEPDLLVLDEPAASLDPAARREFLRVVLTVAASGTRTVLFSHAHYLRPGGASPIASRILSAGKNRLPR